MNVTVSCPKCRALLRSEKPLPPGAKLRCPDCKERFQAPAEVEPAHPVPGLFGSAFVIAMSTAVLIGGSIVAAALIFAGRPEPVQSPTTNKENVKPGPSSDEVAKQLAELKKQQEGLDKREKALKMTNLLVQGKKALTQKNFSEAEKIFEGAVDDDPNNADAVKGLTDAKVGQTLAKTIEEDQRKRQEKISKFLGEGKAALAEKKYAAAVAALESARTIDPTDKDVLDGLTTARTALDTDETKKKKLGDFRKHMDAGKAALDANLFADAFKNYDEAVRLMPNDLEAAQGVQVAKNKLANEADAMKRRQAFDALVARGNDLVKEKRFQAGIANLAEALKLVGDDKAALRDKRDADLGLKDAKAKNALLLPQADQAFKLGDFVEASRLADMARKNWAEDKRAEKLFQVAEVQAGKVRASRDAYDLAFQKGGTAFTNLNYAAAVAAYNEALRLVPGDVLALRQLKLAEDALGRQVQRRLDADRLIRKGQLALIRTPPAFDEAEQSFSQALKLVRGDLKANQGLIEARYGRAMVAGRAAFLARARDEAIRQYESALVEKPNDFAARNGLSQAKALPVNPAKGPKPKPKGKN